MKCGISASVRWYAGVLLFLLSVGIARGSEDPGWLERKVRTTQRSGTVYELLMELSEQIGYRFVYDGELINSERAVRLGQDEYTLREAVYAITGDRKLKIERVGNHILLSRGEEEEPLVRKRSLVLPSQTIEGTVFDLYSKEVISTATVSITGTSLGTITNQDGRFRISIPDSLADASLRISHVGYENYEEALSELDRWVELALEPKVIPLQEVVIRPGNPNVILKKMAEHRMQNYSSSPVYLTSFYREVVERKKKNKDLTEAVIRTYKTGYEREEGDQAQLIKMRHVYNRPENDTLLAKVKSGILSTMLLDVVKVLPDFLLIEDPDNPYEYTHIDLNVVNDRLVHVVAFEQKKWNHSPLYRGELFIDTETYALVEARFEVNPAYVKKATSLFVEKRSKLFNLILRKAAYVVSYRPDEQGVYYLNYIRGEIDFRVRRKKQWGSSPLDIWFELVTCDVSRQEVVPFQRSERLSVRSVFSETEHEYDTDFWQGFHVILPEDELKELIMNSLNRVTEVEE